MAAADSHTLDGLFATLVVPFVVVVDVARTIFLPAPAPPLLADFFWLGKGISSSCNVKMQKGKY
jgi:hypothetical protein